MKVGVIVFPGSNCDRDALRAIDDVLGAGVATRIWHEERSLDGIDAVILPGGFSWGDYLRTGALARFAPIMTAVREAGDAGMPVLGICNGFQVLCEARLLPGVLLRNDHSRFRCDIVEIEFGTLATPWTCAIEPGTVLRLPIAHGEGRYHVDAPQLAELEATDRIIARYVGSNPNGSIGAIAGISSVHGNVVGMMPHPERAVHEWMGSSDGCQVLESLRQHLATDQLPAVRELVGAHADAH